MRGCQHSPQSVKHSAETGGPRWSQQGAHMTHTVQRSAGQVRRMLCDLGKMGLVKSKFQERQGRGLSEPWAEGGTARTSS